MREQLKVVLLAETGGWFGQAATSTPQLPQLVGQFFAETNDQRSPDPRGGGAQVPGRPQEVPAERGIVRAMAFEVESLDLFALGGNERVDALKKSQHFVFAVANFVRVDRFGHTHPFLLKEPLSLLAGGSPFAFVQPVDCLGHFRLLVLWGRNPSPPRSRG